MTTLPSVAKLGAVAAASIALAGGGIIGLTCACVIPSGGGSGGGNTIYVATTGNDGTCVANNPSLPCLTFDGACAKASPGAGDTVSVSAGTYTSGFGISSSCTAGTSGNHVTFQPGGSVTLDGSMNIGASHITVKNFTWCCQTNNAKDDNEVFNISNGVSDDLMQGDDNSGFAIFKADSITLQGGDYGPCTRNTTTTCEPDIFGDNTGSSPGSATNIVLDGVTIHGEHTSGVLGDCGNPADVCHVVGMACFGCNGVTVKNSKFYDNNVDNFFPQNCCGNGGPSNITLTNNWFGPVQGASDGNISLSNSGETYTNFHILFNAFAINQPIFPPSSTNIPGFQYIGNIVTMNDPFFCPPSTGTQDYNIFVGDTSDDHCGTNFGVITSGTPWLNTSNSSALDLHLGGSFTGTSPDNYVPTSVTGGCPTTDYDGQTRPIGTNCDAGPDER